MWHLGKMFTAIFRRYVLARAEGREGKGRGGGRGRGSGRERSLIKSLDEYIRNAIRNDIKVKYGVNFKGGFFALCVFNLFTGGKAGLPGQSSLSLSLSQGVISGEIIRQVITCLFIPAIAETLRSLLF